MVSEHNGYFPLLQNLAEIQTYVNILQQINQTLPLVPNVSLGISEVRSLILCMCVSACAHKAAVPEGEDMFACVSGWATCSGLMRLPAPQSKWVS